MRADFFGSGDSPRALAVTAGLLALLLLAGRAQAQSLSGLHVGDDVGATASLGARPSATQRMGEFTVSKWTLQNGNDLSVTASRSGRKIVFLESDFGGVRSGLASDYPGLSFVRTNLADIRSRFGSNGFAFLKGPAGMTQAGLVQANCYHVAGSVGTVACFITLVKSADEEEVIASPSSVARLAKLTSIILADQKYLEGIWGRGKLLDPDQKPIDWRE